MIGIIDYKAGNAPSVLNALKKLEIDAQLISTPEQVEAASKIILPGVGSALATMDSLKESNLIRAMEKKVLHDGTPFLGICVGLQVLFEHSEEDDARCLGWLSGEVKKFPEQKVRVPQIGWNEVKFNKDHSIVAGINKMEFFYFVNSYYVVPEDDDIILAKTQYGLEFCSMIAFKNIFAAQFHIEKSGSIGLQLLKNFALRAGGSQC